MSRLPRVMLRDHMVLLRELRHVRLRCAVLRGLTLRCVM